LRWLFVPLPIRDVVPGIPIYRLRLPVLLFDVTFFPIAVGTYSSLYCSMILLFCDICCFHVYTLSTFHSSFMRYCLDDDTVHCHCYSVHSLLTMSTLLLTTFVIGNCSVEYSVLRDVMLPIVHCCSTSDLIHCWCIVCWLWCCCDTLPVISFIVVCLIGTRWWQVRFHDRFIWILIFIGRYIDITIVIWPMEVFVWHFIVFSIVDILLHWWYICAGGYCDLCIVGIGIPVAFCSIIHYIYSLLSSLVLFCCIPSDEFWLYFCDVALTFDIVVRLEHFHFDGCFVLHSFVVEYVVILLFSCHRVFDALLLCLLFISRVIFVVIVVIIIPLLLMDLLSTMMLLWLYLFCCCYSYIPVVIWLLIIRWCYSHSVHFIVDTLFFIGDHCSILMMLLLLLFVVHFVLVFYSTIRLLWLLFITIVVLDALLLIHCWLLLLHWLFCYIVQWWYSFCGDDDTLFHLMTYSVWLWYYWYVMHSILHSLLHCYSIVPIRPHSSTNLLPTVIRVSDGTRRRYRPLLWWYHWHSWWPFVFLHCSVRYYRYARCCWNLLHLLTFIVTFCYWWSVAICCLLPFVPLIFCCYCDILDIPVVRFYDCWSLMMIPLYCWWPSTRR